MRAEGLVGSTAAYLGVTRNPQGGPIFAALGPSHTG
jgi:hypothetical protein